MKKTHLLSLILFLSFESFAQSDSIFSYFTVQQKDNSIVLLFTIKGGIQCTGLKVERSGDGMSYQEIYEFPGICGSPGADESYIFTDAYPERNKINYYRMQIGSSGIFSTAQHVFFTYYVAGKLQVHPNPCSSCTIRFPNDKKDLCGISIYNSSGQLVQQLTTREQFFYMPDMLFDQGLFYIEVACKTGTVLTGRVIRE